MLGRCCWSGSVGSGVAAVRRGLGVAVFNFNSNALICASLFSSRSTSPSEEAFRRQRLGAIGGNVEGDEGLIGPAVIEGGSAWERLAGQMQDEGFRSPYMDKLHAKVPSASTPEAAVKGVEDEIKGEIAASLSSAESKIHRALALLEYAKERAARAASKSEEKEAVEAYNAIRREAMVARHNLLVQRQACGFKTGNVAQVEAQYPIPPPLSQE